MTSQGMASDGEASQLLAETHDTQLAARPLDVAQGPCVSPPEIPRHPTGLGEPASAREANTQMETLPAPAPAPGASGETPQPAPGQSLPPLPNVVGAVGLATPQLPSPPLGSSTLPQPVSALESDGEGPPPRVGFVDSTIKSLDEKLRNLLYQEHVPTSSASAGTPVETGDRDFALEPPRGDMPYTEAPPGDQALPPQLLVSTGLPRGAVLGQVWTGAAARSSLATQSASLQPGCPALRDPPLSLACPVCLQQMACLGTQGVCVQGQNPAGTNWCVERLGWGMLSLWRGSPGMRVGICSLAAEMLASEAPGSFLSVSSSRWTSPNWPLGSQLCWSRPRPHQ